MFTCIHCGKEFENQFALKGHLSHCVENKDKKRTRESYLSSSRKSGDTLIEKHKEYRALHPEKYLLQEFTCNCGKCGKEYTVNVTQEQFDKGKYKKNCSRECANSRIMSETTKRKISNSIKKHINVFGAITHSGAPKRKTYICKECGKCFTIGDKRDTNGRLYCSKKCRHEWLSKNTGGYRKGSGVGKSGWYKGIHCDSTWELAFLIYHLDNGLPIERCKERRKYIFDGAEHTYCPDFVTDKGVIEIKGYSSPQWEAKQKQNTDVIVLYKNDMIPYIEYAKSKYGDCLSDLYDANR